MKKLAYKFNGNTAYQSIINSLVESFGIPVYGDRNCLFKLNTGSFFCTYVDSGKICIAYSEGGYAAECDEVCFADFIKYLLEVFDKKKPVSVKLNNDYTAEVTNVIKVGCQTFPLSIIDDLANAVKTYKSI